MSHSTPAGASGTAGPAAETSTGSGTVPPPPRSSRSLLLRGGSWNSLAQLSPLVVNLVLTPFVINGLGIDRYGLFMLISIIGAFMGSFDGGLGSSAGRYFTVYAGTGDRDAATRLLTTLVLVVSGIGVVTFTVFFLAAPRLLRAFDIPTALRGEGVFLLRTLSVLVIFGLLRSLFSGVLAAHHRFAYTSLVNVALYVVYAVAAYLAVTYGFGLRGIAVGLMAQSVLATALIVPAACRYLSRSGVGLLPRGELWAFMRFSANVQLVGLVNLFNQEADSLITGALLPIRFVGYLSAGASFATQIRGIPLNALVPLQSILGREYAGVGEDGARAELHRMQRLWVTGATGWSLVGAPAAYFGVTAWLGPDFHLSGLVAGIVVFGNMFDLLTRATTVWCTVVGRPQLHARYSAVTVVLNLVLTLALIVPFEVVGVVAATATAQALGSLYLIRLTRRGLDLPIRSFLRDVPVLPGLVAFALSWGAEAAVQPLVPEGALGLLLCGAVAAPALAVFAVLALGPRRAWSMVAGRLPGRRAAR